MTVQLFAKSKSIPDQVSAAEWAARVELAAGHRVLAHYGVNDLTYNHFGLRLPGVPDHMLIKRTDWMFSEVTASSLLKVDFDGNVLTDTDVTTVKGGALIIHAGLLKGRPDLNATLHTHTVSGMGVAAHKFGLLPINQHALRFYGEIKYHEFEGFEFDHDMTPKLLRDLDGGCYMILRNHGALVCGESVAECVVNSSLAGNGVSGPDRGTRGGGRQLYDPRQGGLRIRSQPVHRCRQFPQGREGLGGLSAPRRAARSLLQRLTVQSRLSVEPDRRQAIAEEVARTDLPAFHIRAVGNDPVPP
jgi:ribulose-5-phosphate 4-epimerase/fuculose-1-phosphate aldolase